MQEAQENAILSVLYHAGDTIPLSKIADILAKKGLEKDIKTTIGSMLKLKLINQDGKQRIALSKNAPVYTGTLSQNPKGFGFVTQTKSINNNPAPKRDPFISFSRMSSAHHGDSVLIRILRTRQDNRPEATIIQVLSQGSNTITGTYITSSRGGRFHPDDPGYPFTVNIASLAGLHPHSGDMVIVEYQREQKPTRVLQGTLLEVLGSPGNIDTQVRVIADKFGLSHEFNDNIIQETQALKTHFKPEKTREDLRATDHITIDGESAKDFDDAICVTKTRKGFRLFVSIADVSFFVQPGSAIDKEAYSRGTSIYFPGRVIPMLPTKLSNDLCSLVPGQDRFTLTVTIDFDSKGTLLKKRFSRSIICSKNRFTYTTVQQILIEKNPEIRRQHKPFLTQLKWAQELATALREKRRLRGSLDFNIAEAEIILTSKGEVDSIKKVKRNFAHFMIEEFMIIANEATASFFSEKSIPILYRVHEPPAPEKTDNFLAFIQTFGLAAKPFENSPGWYAHLLKTCKNTQYEYIINTLLLRSMKQAHYTSKNSGHFGLSSINYTHFTSPIRRYPDLLVHRQLIKLLEDAPGKKENSFKTPETQNDGNFLSSRERIAVQAEREMNDRLKLHYMKKHIGESFTAVISGVSDFALFIELQDPCVSGSIATEYLDDDYYIFDEKNYRLFGEITGKIYQIGDILQVTLIDINSSKRRINFTLKKNVLSR